VFAITQSWSTLGTTSAFARNNREKLPKRQSLHLMPLPEFETGISRIRVYSFTTKTTFSVTNEYATIPESVTYYSECTSLNHRPNFSTCNISREMGSRLVPETHNTHQVHPPAATSVSTVWFDPDIVTGFWPFWDAEWRISLCINRAPTHLIRTVP